MFLEIHPFQDEQVRRAEKKVEREKLVLANLPKLSLKIVELAREHGRVTIGEVVTLTAASRNTLKQHLRMLVECGRMNQHGVGSGYGMNCVESSTFCDFYDDARPCSRAQ